jgi:type IV pilus assembly protein PilC
MLNFKYTARNPKTGQKTSGEISAQSENSAAKQLKAEGLVPIEILGADKEKRNVVNRFRNRIKTKDKVLFSRQLATLVNAGLPLAQSLQTVGEQTKNKYFKSLIGRIITEVESGATLSNAMATYPDVFDDIYVNLVAAGESSGTLDKALERLAVRQEKDAELMSKIRGALIYPVLVIVVMVLVVGFLVVRVIPQVEEVYKGIPGATLPLLTRLMLAVSHFVMDFWWVLAVLALAGAVFTTRWARTGHGKLVVDGLKMRVWPIGQLFMKMYMARFARTGSTLVGAGLPLLQVLQITGASIGNVHIENSIKKASEKVKGGVALSDALREDANILDLVPNMLRVGEQSGTVEQMLGKTADYYEKEVDNQIKAISTLVEPILIVILGLVAFVVVAAVLLPIYGLAGKSLGGGV